MEFGHVDDAIAAIDFSLPPDTAGTRRTLGATKDDGELQVFVGAPKWGEQGWIGKIYPRKTPNNALLPLYCKNFNTVEFGPTFYSIYTPEQLNRWVQQVADAPDFKFCPKFPQHITHIRRLSDTEEQTAKFYESLELTNNQAVIRFVGNDLASSDYTRMDEWVERLKTWKTMGLKTVWFFVHQHNEQFVPEACAYLIRRLNDRLGTAIAGPRFLTD